MGTPCCDSEGEAFEKTHTPVHNVIFGRAWDQAAESRWLHVTKILKRWMLASVSTYVLPGSVKHMQIHWRIDEGMIASLTRQIQADANNFSAKSKLRLLRICQNLCPPEAEQEIATHLIAVKSVDNILYSALGNKDRGVRRATIRDFADGETSPIAVALRRLTYLLDNFNEEAEGWQLLMFTRGADCSSPAMRKRCRRELMQNHCGIVDQFEIRFGKPPYTVCRCVKRGAPPVNRAGRLAEVHQ